ncbi:AI-2E family transporter [Ferdinandcohnia quinoae]|uniref:AI-2E family transporter n=1 Tax=Fredinandcohnia quinoae TaxID=2918902 RepID=A0AAW5E3A9_9BACI|nr:AI-2E family transporter [Fredinandcohnia sp. SECRCQ15]MCH1627406.1 AI-2E family transporter [Fredinandcohnia sp. SECRCQ15]
MKDIKVKWIYRFLIMLLAFLSILVFMKLAPIWLPVVKILKTFLLPFIISIFITYLLLPIVERINNRGVPRTIAILLIYLIFFGGIGFGIYRGIPIVIHQLKDLADSFPQFVNTYRGWLHEVETRTANLPVGIHERIEDFFLSIEAYLDSILKSVVNLTGIINSILLLAIIPFIVFYMLKDYNQMIKVIWYITPRKIRKSGQLFLRDVDESLGNYIRGQLVVCLLVGGVTSLAFWVFGMKYPLLLGIIVGMTNIIPYFGPIIGAIPAAIIAATLSIKLLVIVVLIIFVLQFIEGNLLSPLIVGKSLRMHPIVIMAALLLGGEIGGIIGLIVAVPVVAILKVFIVHAKLHFMHN